VMQIAYYEMIPMLIPLYFSSRDLKKTNAHWDKMITRA
jgi:hypothetical protein